MTAPAVATPRATRVLRTRFDVMSEALMRMVGTRYDVNLGMRRSVRIELCAIPGGVAVLDAE